MHFYPQHQNYLLSTEKARNRPLLNAIIKPIRSLALCHNSFHKSFNFLSFSEDITIVHCIDTPRHYVDWTQLEKAATLDSLVRYLYGRKQKQISAKIQGKKLSGISKGSVVWACCVISSKLKIICYFWFFLQSKRGTKQSLCFWIWEAIFSSFQCVTSVWLLYWVTQNIVSLRETPNNSSHFNKSRLIWQYLGAFSSSGDGWSLSGREDAVWSLWQASISEMNHNLKILV